jgi:hypothetical protein
MFEYQSMARMKLKMIPFIFVISSMELIKLSLLTMVLNFRRDRLYLFYNLMVKSVPFMWYGHSQRIYSPAVVVTAYRPDPDPWNNSFTQRKG